MSSKKMGNSVLEISFSSIDDLIQKASYLSIGWKARWFRGCQSDKFSLLPKILRTYTYNEDIISVEFRRKMRSEFHQAKNEFDWLVCMQHYGVPTRLLDWSESLIVSLYFSCLPIKSDISPTIWMLDPFNLNKLTKNQDIVYLSDDEDILNLSRSVFGENKNAIPKFPIPVIPDYIFPRLRSQDSCFTMHGSDNSPLELQLESIDSDIPVLYKFVCENNKTKHVMIAVEMLCNHMLIFPDIEGFSRYIGPEEIAQ